MIKFITAKIKKTKILSVDAHEFADIVKITDSYIELRLVFNISLMAKDNNAELCNKVIVSLERQGYGNDNDTVIAYDGITKINENPTDMSLVRQLPQHHPAYSTSSTLDNVLKSKPQTQISSQASQKLASRFSIVNNYINSKNSQDKITSCTVYLSDYINDALKNPYEVTELIVPENVRLINDQRLTSERIEKNSLVSDVNNDFVTPVSILAEEENTNFLQRKFIDYFLQDAPLPPKDVIDRLTFYKLTKNLAYLTKIQIPCMIKLPLRFSNSTIQVDFKLYEHNDTRAAEYVSARINIKNLKEAYEVLDGFVIVDHSIKNADSKFEKNYLANFDYSGNDFEKIKFFNIYTKALNNFGNRLSSYTLKSSISAPKNIENFNTLSFLGNSAESLHVIRIVPVTESGESSIFSDIVLGEGIKTNLISSLVLTAYQGDANNVTIDIKNINTNLDFLKIYRRLCRKNSNATFTLVGFYKKVSSTNFVWDDFDTIEDEIYEYYATVESADSTKQISNYDMITYRRQSKNKAKRISIEGLAVTNQSVSFTITTSTQTNDNSNTLYSAALNSAYEGTEMSNSPQLQSLSPLTNMTFKPPSPKDFKDLFFHSVSRIDLTNGNKATFNLVSDGQFVDNDMSRLRDSISGLVPGRTYIYHIQTFTRDPLSVKTNFIASGEKNNSNWFHRPYKWLNPKVIASGILYDDDEDGIASITNFENYTAEAVSDKLTSEITIPTSPTYEPINPNAIKISRNVVKISWELSNKNFYDSFVVVKVVNGVRKILGKTKIENFYHKIEPNDLGTIYYEITCILSNFSIGNTYYSNNILCTEDLSYKRPRVLA